jgi:type IV secretory pathway TrbF-like protein
MIPDDPSPAKHTDGQDPLAIPPLAWEEFEQDERQWRQVEQAYREIQRRDDRAEVRTWRAERFAMLLLGILVLLLGVIVWQQLDHRTMQAFVQVVQIDDQGRLVQQGIPQDLLKYTPPEGVWMEMLSSWIRAVRWRGTDPVLAKAQWAWAYRHTCGEARHFLQAMEEKEQPFKPSKKLVAVEVKSVTKTPAPESYQVLWTENSTEPSSPSVKTTMWTGTFSTGRLRLTRLADVLENRLGLCAAAFDMSQQP